MKERQLEKGLLSCKGLSEDCKDEREDNVRGGNNEKEQDEGVHSLRP